MYTQFPCIYIFYQSILTTHSLLCSDPLPTGAIQGGQWSDGTPLYVALGYARVDKHVIGYYNHATRIGTCDYFGVNNVQNLELLVVGWTWVTNSQQL